MEEKDFDRSPLEEVAPVADPNDAPLDQNAEGAQKDSDEGAGALKSETEKTERNEFDDEEITDGIEFVARYHSAKENDLKKLSEKMEGRAQNNTKKKKWMNAVKITAMILLIGFSVGLMFGLSGYLNEEGQKGFGELLKTTFSWQYFLIFLAVIAGYILFESLKYAYLFKISIGKWRLKNSVKVMFLGKYYDGVTPLGTGGQPFQIYYLHKRNVPAGVATAVPLVKYIVTTYVFGSMCAVFLGLAPWYFKGNSDVSSALSISCMAIAWVSLAFNLFIPTAMILLSAFPKAGKKIIVWIVKALNKLRIVKHPYPVAKKYVYEVAEYRNALKLLFRKWYMLIPLVLLAVAECFILLAMPLFSVMAFAGNADGVNITGELLMQILCLSTVSFYVASLVPTPGNSGASEASSSFVFSTVMTNPAVTAVSGWVIFLWRFSTFYFYILVGVCMRIASVIREIIRVRRERKNQNKTNQT